MLNKQNLMDNNILKIAYNKMFMNLYITCLLMVSVVLMVNYKE